jgi:protease-4
MLASGGYWFAMSGDKIFADYGAVIGSIGVKGPDWLYYNSPTSLSNGILGSSVESNNGIKLFSNTAGKSKDIFNPFRKPTQKEQEYLQEIVDDIYEDFANLVSSKRKIEKNIIKNEIGAMIFNTKKAQENFLIDSQKNIDQVTKYLLKELNDNTLQIINNSKTEGYNLLGINFIERMIFKDYENIANKKFCNNLLNEFSVILNNVKNTKC